MTSSNTTSTKKNKILKIRVTEDEYNYVKDFFPYRGMLSEYVRGYLFGGSCNPEEIPKRIKRKPDADRLKLAGEIGKVGNNLNQLARACNKLAKIGQRADFFKILLKVEEIQKELNKLVKQ